MSENLTESPLTKKDFASDQMIRWCPGCGDYSILSAMQNTMAQMNKKTEKLVFISGIGCASRFPYYMNTYGFHTIHGRGPAVATGVKLANPDLEVWEIQGDGDALAIGGNHFIHTIRRNLDINILLFNNEIYGLTKGQYSPTSKIGLVTKSTPQGGIERPFNPGELTIGSNGSFFARTIDTNPKLMSKIFVDAAGHKGTSIVEILQNCVIYNDKTHGAVTNKENRDDFQLHLEHGKPMVFGKEKNKGIILNGFELEIVTLGENGVSEGDILVHDAHKEDNTFHLMLVKMKPPKHPMALGVVRAVKAVTFDELVTSQIKEGSRKTKIKNMDDLLCSGNTWEVN